MQSELGPEMNWRSVVESKQGKVSLVSPLELLLMVMELTPSVEAMVKKTQAMARHLSMLVTQYHRLRRHYRVVPRGKIDSYHAIRVRWQWEGQQLEVESEEYGSRWRLRCASL